MMRFLGVSTLLVLLVTATTHAFQSPSLFASPRRTTSDVVLKAGKGFGKQPPPEQPKPKKKRTYTTGPTPEAEPQQQLRSIDEQPPPPPPTMAETIPTVEEDYDDSPFPEVELDPNLSQEERAEILLREKFGMKPAAEQEKEKESRRLQKEAKKKELDVSRKLEGWEKKAEEKGDFDLMEALPAPLLVAIDRFLKAGVAVSTVLFVAAGLGITLEAWSTATNSPLPDDIDAFIVNTVEPNFTPGLFVLLGFSVSLGVFAAAQLGSSGSKYTED
uniref:Transmembrane protein n=2 Tax=Grammatophora oceanica TaxID=210454 RepID=A0A7S1VP37_9STRA|mmetsp:Transcript_50389/g.75313  ORF Transcript_50389/g.75313 Transcript_50389/m.75313 type:complete len:273 (+) Transcript_50389:147-965(+)